MVDTHLTIYKYPVYPEDEYFLEIPKVAKFLSVQMQCDQPQMWWLVDLDSPYVRRKFRVFGTGHEVREAANELLVFLGTLQMNGGTFVFHLFEVTERTS